MTQPSTPEEKLLRLIESPLGKEQKEGPLKDKVKEAPKPKGFNLKGLLSLFRQKEKLLSVKNMNKALIWVSALLTVSALIHFGVNFMNFKKNIDGIEHLSYADTARAEKKITAKINMDEALRQIQSGNLFVPITYEREIEISPDTQEAKKRLKLVGVIWSANPQAMVEDERDKRTYLVSAGESIAGGVLIKEIFRDKAVVVGVEGQEWELR
jgi:hypothetical protein